MSAPERITLYVCRWCGHTSLRETDRCYPEQHNEHPLEPVEYVLAASVRGGEPTQGEDRP